MCYRSFCECEFHSDVTEDAKAAELKGGETEDAPFEFDEDIHGLVEFGVDSIKGVLKLALR